MRGNNRVFISSFGEKIALRRMDSYLVLHKTPPLDPNLCFVKSFVRGFCLYNFPVGAWHTVRSLVYNFHVDSFLC